MEKKHSYTHTGYACLRENEEGSFAVLETLCGSRLDSLEYGAWIERENPIPAYYAANPIIGTVCVEVTADSFERRKHPKK